jgi:anti-sigma factor RsiW
MTCLNDGTIQAYIDHEITAPELERVEHHLAACADCRTRIESASRNSTLVCESLSALASEASPITNPGIAYARFRSQLDEQTAAPA